MPLIGSEKIKKDAIEELILYFSSSDVVNNLVIDSNNLNKNLSHIKIEGSTWYADWWLEDLPFLFLVENVILD